MRLDGAWNAVVTQATTRWPQAPARPALAPAGDGYRASIVTPDGELDEHAVTPELALEQLALVIAGTDRTDILIRVRRAEARIARDAAAAELQQRQADVDRLGG